MISGSAVASSRCRWPCTASRQTLSPLDECMQWSPSSRSENLRGVLRSKCLADVELEQNTPPLCARWQRPQIGPHDVFGNKHHEAGCGPRLGHILFEGLWYQSFVDCELAPEGTPVKHGRGLPELVQRYRSLPSLDSTIHDFGRDSEKLAVHAIIGGSRKMCLARRTLSFPARGDKPTTRGIASQDLVQVRTPGTAAVSGSSHGIENVIRCPGLWARWVHRRGGGGRGRGRGRGSESGVALRRRSRCNASGRVSNSQ